MVKLLQIGVLKDDAHGIGYGRKRRYRQCFVTLLLGTERVLLLL